MIRAIVIPSMVNVIISNNNLTYLLATSSYTVRSQQWVLISQLHEGMGPVVVSAYVEIPFENSGIRIPVSCTCT